LQNAALVCNCGLPGEAVYPDLEQLPDLTGYFTTIIVKEEA
jgi:precorrin-2 methylase